MDVERDVLRRIDRLAARILRGATSLRDSYKLRVANIDCKQMQFETREF